MIKIYPVVRNRILRCYMRLYDFIAALMVSSGEDKKVDIKRILLRNPAAMGDTWYTLRLANAIKKKNPDMEIGMLVGSWSADMVRECADVSYVHVEDHPIMNRRRISIWKKMCQWYKTRRQALRELKAIGYDAAIDCYYYYPSCAYLFYQAGVSCRVGYDSREGNCFYTKLIHWDIFDIHNVEYQAELVKSLSLDIDDLTLSSVNFNHCDCLSDEKIYIDKEYIVIAVGTGEPIREWKREKWASLIDRIYTYNYTIYLVGAGCREKELIDYLTTKKRPNIISLCNLLSVPQLSEVIKNAKLFIGLESFAGHIAATYKIPQISIMHGSTNKYHWQPYSNDNCYVLRKNLPCNTCYYPSVCVYNNACMDISVDEVIKAVDDLLKKDSEDCM